MTLSGLFVGYCYDLDHSLIVDIGVSVITIIFLGINSVIKLVRCHRTGLSTVQPHLPLWKALMRCYCHVSHRCLQRGKVMGARYPDQVGGHKPCVPVVVVMDPCPRLGPFLPRWWPFFHDGGRWCLW